MNLKELVIKRDRTWSFIKKDWKNLINIGMGIITIFLVILFQCQSNRSKFSISGGHGNESDIIYEPLLSNKTYDVFGRQLKLFNFKDNPETNFIIYKWLLAPIWIETKIVNQRNNSFSIIDYKISVLEYEKDIKFSLNDTLMELYGINEQSNMTNREPIFIGPKEAKIFKFQFNFPIIPNDLSSLKYLDRRTRKYYPKRDLELFKNGISNELVNIYNKETDSTYFICKEAFYDLIFRINLKVQLKLTDNNDRNVYSEYIEIKK
jgi:hypothetical protein